MLHLARLTLSVAVLPLTLGLLAGAAHPACAQDSQAVRRIACGGYDIVPSGFRRPDEPSRVNIQKAGRLMVSITDWRIVSMECDDITADGIQELVVRTFSGGAHCCETLHVYALAKTPRLILSYEANNAVGAEVRDINGDGRRELILGDDTFAYFDDLCYACSPANLPLVACFADARFEDCTRQFPALLRGRRDAYLSRVGPATDDDSLAQIRGAALGVVAISTLLGEEDQGLAAVKHAGAGEAVVAWLSKALPQIREWVTTRGRKIRDGKE